MNQQELEALVAEWRRANAEHERAVEKQAEHKRRRPAQGFRYPSLDAYNEYEARATDWEFESRRIDSEVIDAYNRLGKASTPLMNALPTNVWIGLSDGTEIGRTPYKVLGRKIDTSGCGGAPADVQEAE